MKELDKTKIYDLSEFTSNEKNQLLIKLIEIDVSWDKELPKEEFFSSDFLYFSTDYVSKGEWLVSDEIQYTDKEIVNAKELFYNLENVQVDCRYLTNEQIDEIADVFKKYGYRIGSLSLMEEYCFIRQNAGKYCLVTTKHKNKTTITYEKFMELFGYKEKSEEFKNLVEVLNEELTEEAERESKINIAEKPKHYSKGIDTFARMEANCTKEECLAFAKGNIDKYNFRTKGQDLEDYKKIVSYANWAISLLNKS